MSKGYKKILYDNNPGFRLHHTKGQFASESTTGYLHYDVELSFIYFIHGIGEIKIEGKKYKPYFEMPDIKPCEASAISRHYNKYKSI